MADNVFGITDPGKVRQNNEDNFIAQYAAGDRYIAACVIDGVGGYSGGEIAAEIARETILTRLDKISPPKESLLTKEPNGQGEMVPLLVDAFNVANEKIWQEKQAVEEHKNMACVITLAVADLSTNQFYYAHLGDTRLYLLRDGSLVKISHDQSFVGFLEDSGRLNEKEAMRHPKRNEIDKALGFKSAFTTNDDIETGQSPFLPGDMLLLCSDGLTDMVDKAAITEIMTSAASLKNIGEALIEAANNGGGKDNITVVLVKNDKAQQQHAATKPVETLQPEKLELKVREKKKTVNTEQIENGRPAKSYKGLFILFLILALGLVALCGWQYLTYQNSSGTNTGPEPLTPVKLVKPLNPQEIKLQDAINNVKGKMLVLSDTAFKSPVILSRTITIDRDTLYIKSKGNITFQSDSTLAGPAFRLTGKTKNIVLDSLVFQNFDTVISASNKALALKNVRFKNCKTLLQNSFSFPDNKYISGDFGSVVFKADSLPKIK
jgi:serine/threonine protein phosphatase PrpC